MYFINKLKNIITINISCYNNLYCDEQPHILIVYKIPRYQESDFRTYAPQHLDFISIKDMRHTLGTVKATLLIVRAPSCTY